MVDRFLVFLFILGICALCESESKSYVACPAHDIRGDVMIYDVVHLQIVAIIKAHSSSLRCLCFNKSGTLLATCSEKVFAPYII